MPLLTRKNGSYFKKIASQKKEAKMRLNEKKREKKSMPSPDKDIQDIINIVQNEKIV